ncbi:MAG TPA: response regulator [Gammaproteobacteria bacterium]|nr:response regulator [Gammaproteobacteria bacterium]
MAKRILVVEDETNSRVAMADFLSDNGFDVATAASSDRAVEIGRRFRPEILICDWMLEGSGDGVSVARQLHQTLPDLVIVFVTGYPLETLHKESESLHVHRYLSKPFGLYDLNRVLDEIVSDIGH